MKAESIKDDEDEEEEEDPSDAWCWEWNTRFYCVNILLNVWKNMNKVNLFLKLASSFSSLNTKICGKLWSINWHKDN